MDLKLLLELLWRRKAVVLQAVFIFMAVSVIGSLFLPSIYEATSRLSLIRGGAAGLVLTNVGISDTQSVLIQDKDQFATEIETFIELATSDAVLNDVIQKLQIRSDDGNFLEPKDIRESTPIISSIFPKPNVEIEQQGDDTRLLDIQAQATDPDMAAKLANTVAEIFVTYLVEGRRADFRAAKTFIERQIDGIKAEYLNILDDIRAYQEKHNILELSSEIKSAVTKTSELLEGKEEVIRQIAETGSKIAFYKINLGELSDSVVSSGALNENPHILDLKLTLSELNQQLVQEITEKKRGHPDVKVIQRKIDAIKKELQAEIGVMQVFSQQLKDAEAQLKSYQARLSTINSDIKRNAAIFEDYPQKEMEFAYLETRRQQAQERYGELLETLYGVSTAEAMELTDLQLIEKAKTPDEDRPASPKGAIIMVLGTFLGVFFGISLALLVDYLDDSVTSGGDVENLGLPFLGMIPRGRKKDGLLISQRDPKDPLSEAYRSLRNRIKFEKIDAPPSTLLITSPYTADGRSLTAANLAISLAAEEKRVLLVDADLRHPTLHDLFDEQNDRGVTTIIEGKHTLSEAIRPTAVSGMDLLTSGPVPLDPGRLLESNKMQALIQEQSQAYDTVVFDAPPISVDHNDAVILSRYVDGPLMVIKEKRVSHQALADILLQTQKAGVHMVGAVINSRRLVTKKKRRRWLPLPFFSTKWLASWHK